MTGRRRPVTQRAATAPVFRRRGTRCSPIACARALVSRSGSRAEEASQTSRLKAAPWRAARHSPAKTPASQRMRRQRKAVGRAAGVSARGAWKEAECGTVPREETDAETVPAGAISGTNGAAGSVRGARAAGRIGTDTGDTTARSTTIFRQASHQREARTLAGRRGARRQTAQTPAMNRPPPRQAWARRGSHDAAKALPSVRSASAPIVSVPFAVPRADQGAEVRHLALGQALGLGQIRDEGRERAAQTLLDEVMD